MKTPKNEKRPQGLRQSMSSLHTWMGLLLGWVLYAMFLTGTTAYFKDELSQWMRPEAHRTASLPAETDVAKRMAEHFDGTAQWTILLPTDRHPLVYGFWTDPAGGARRGFREAHFDPFSTEVVKARETMGGDFFYRFHFQFHHIPVSWGRWLAGLAAMFMLIAIISGIITHKKIFIDFFTFRWGKGQRSWLDAHNALSVFGLPFHLMITYTGLITLMAMYMPWGQDAAIKTPEDRMALSAQTRAFAPRVPASGEPAPLASVEAMVAQAQARWGAGNIGRISVTQAGDRAARVSISRIDTGRVSMSPYYLLFEGHSGQLLEAREQVGAAAETRGVLYGLHLGRFSDLVTRWLYFIVSLAGTAMVGTGLVLWTVKRRQKLQASGKPEHFGLWLVDRLNIGSIAGLSLAITGFLWANRLLPLATPDRAAAEIQVFFIVWGAAFVHALLRPSRAAWREQWLLAALALALLPFLNAWTTDRSFVRSLATGDGLFLMADILFLMFAALHAVLAWRCWRPKSKSVRVAPVRSAKVEEVRP